MSGTFIRPQFDLLSTIGNQEVKSIPDLIRFNSTHNPTHLFCLQDLGHLGTAPLRINFRDLDAAIQRCRSWLKRVFPSSTTLPLERHGEAQNPRPIALLMESDVRLFIYLAALLWSNIPCLLLSIRLNTEAIRHLIRETGTSAILVSGKTESLAREALREEPTSDEKPAHTPIHQVAALETIFSPDAVPDEQRTYEHCANQQDMKVLILHSSGTTGTPKAIHLTHRYLLGYAACHRFPDDQAVSGINVSTLPLYHGFGFLAPCLALSVGMSCCLPSPSIIPNSQSTMDLLRRTEATSLMTVPSILEDIQPVEEAQTRYIEDFSTLAALSFVAIGGAPLKPSVGENMKAHGVKILNHYGATEIGALAPIFLVDDDYDWRYLRLRSDIGLQLEFLETGGRASGLGRRCRLTGYPFGWGKPFIVQDELECNPLHPTTEVKVIGRNDDLIVLASGEKLAPRLFEEILSKCPLVETAIVFGSGHFELGALIEPAFPVLDSSEAREELVERIWPFVLEANSRMDGHGKITSREAIILKPDEKAFPKSDKGSIMRKQVYQVFAKEIAAVYERLEGVLNDEEAIALDPNDIGKGVREIVRLCLPSHVRTSSLGDEDDIFELGLDSLQAGRLRRILSAAATRMWNKPTQLPRNFCYVHSTASRMVAALRAGPLGHPTDAVSSLDRTESMRSLAQHYSGFGEANSAEDKDQPVKVVLLTGSTGSLGAHVLRLLRMDSSIDRIICLIRSSTVPDCSTHATDDGSRSKEHRTKSSGFESGQTKVEFWHWVAGAPMLGLTREKYAQLSCSVTHILHCAWPMDFKRNLHSFEPHIQAVRTLLQLVILAHQARPYIRPTFVFTSSIAVVGRYPLINKQKTVPEDMTDPSMTLPMGYAEAKWVCEDIIDEAGRVHRERINLKIIRLGQLSGSRSTGHWNGSEHIPVLFQASQRIGQFPKLSGSVSWLPADDAASIVIELMLNQELRREVHVFHLENPIRNPWADISMVMGRKLDLKEEMLAMEEWQQQAVQAGILSEELVDFFERDLARMATGLILDTEKARECSPLLRSTDAVGVRMLELYIESWRSTGVLA